jgi:hypothetical protein
MIENSRAAYAAVASPLFRTKSMLYKATLLPQVAAWKHAHCPDLAADVVQCVRWMIVSEHSTLDPTFALFYNNIDIERACAYMRLTNECSSATVQDVTTVAFTAAACGKNTTDQRTFNRYRSTSLYSDSSLRYAEVGHSTVRAGGGGAFATAIPDPAHHPPAGDGMYAYDCFSIEQMKVAQDEASAHKPQVEQVSATLDWDKFSIESTVDSPEGTSFEEVLSSVITSRSDNEPYDFTADVNGMDALSGADPFDMTEVLAHIYNVTKCNGYNPDLECLITEHQKRSHHAPQPFHQESRGSKRKAAQAATKQMAKMARRGYTVSAEELMLYDSDNSVLEVSDSDDEDSSGNDFIDDDDEDSDDEEDGTEESDQSDDC